MLSKLQLVCLICLSSPLVRALDSCSELSCELFCLFHGSELTLGCETSSCDCEAEKPPTLPATPEDHPGLNPLKTDPDQSDEEDKQQNLCSELSCELFCLFHGSELTLGCETSSCDCEAEKPPTLPATPEDHPGLNPLKTDPDQSDEEDKQQNLWDWRSGGETWWGTWTGNYRCPDGQWLVGMQISFEDEVSNNGDDTAMNGLRLFCSEPKYAKRSLAYNFQSITVHPGWYGYWRSPAYCPDGTYVQALRVRAEANCGSGCDDTALNGVELMCSNSERVMVFAGRWGNWGNWLSCGFGNMIDWVAMLVEGKQDGGDDTSSNRLHFTCRVADPIPQPPAPQCGTLVMEYRNLHAAVCGAGSEREYTTSRGVARTDEFQNNEKLVNSRTNGFSNTLGTSTTASVGGSLKGIDMSVSSTLATTDTSYGEITQTREKMKSYLQSTSVETLTSERIKVAGGQDQCIINYQLMGRCSGGDIDVEIRTDTYLTCISGISTNSRRCVPSGSFTIGGIIPSDKYASCSGWASVGYCSISSFVKEACPFSCSLKSNQITAELKSEWSAVAVGGLLVAACAAVVVGMAVVHKRRARHAGLAKFDETPEPAC